jgi:hypothetical protein
MKTKEQFLIGYTGTFPFLVDLRRKYVQWNRLTPAQWAAVEKCQVTEERRAAKAAATSTSAPMAPQLAIKCNVPLILKRRGAKMVKDDNSLPLYPFTVTAEGVVARTAKATLVDITFTTGSVTVCRCCGKDLTDVRSQATGIGPVCAKRYHIPYPKSISAPEIAKFKLDLENLAKSIGVIRTWIPNRQIKSGAFELSQVKSVAQSGAPQLTKPVGGTTFTSSPKFKVGDKVVANANNSYGLTNSTAGLMTVMSLLPPKAGRDQDIEVALDRDKSRTKYPVSSKCFDLAPADNQGVSVKPAGSIQPIFKVGDYVKGKKVSGNTYTITGPDMTKGIVEQIEYENRGIFVKCITHKTNPQAPGLAYWVKPSMFEPFIDVPLVEFPDTLFRYNAKTYTFESNKDAISDIGKLEKFAIKSSKTGLVAIFNKTTTVTTVGGEVNCWEFYFIPDASTKVQTPMKAVIFND